MRKLFALLSVAVLAALGARGTQAQTYQAPFGPDGSWNLYEFVDATETWVDADIDASSREEEGAAGHLVDILSAEENSWVYGAFGVDQGIDNIWIGLTDREGAAPEITNNGIPVPQESQDLADRLTMGWAWTSGAPLAYNNWGANEPNNWDPVIAGPASATEGKEDAVHIRNDGAWNDTRGGFGENEPIVPSHQVDTSLDEIEDQQFYAYVIEYPVNSPTMLPGYDYPTVPTRWPTGDDLPGISGEDGTMGITEYKAIDDTVDLNGMDGAVTFLEDVINGDVDFEVEQTQLALAKVVDPDAPGGGGPVLSVQPSPFASDVVGQDDQHFIVIGKANVQVPEAGTYTIRVHSDDGFGLRFVGKRFTAENGGGQLDTDGSLIFAANTGNSNQRGTIDLEAGVHPMEWFYWEREGGAYYEITTAQGDFLNSDDARWLGLGDGTQYPDATVGPVVNLTAPLFVGNLLGGGGDVDVDVAREDLLASLANLDYESATIEQLVIDDHDTALGCPFNQNPGFHDPATVDRWPLNDAGVGGDPSFNEEDFSSIIIGEFTVDNGNGVDDESLEVSFHIDVDDRSLFRIVGEDFTAVSDAGGNPLGIMEIEGDDSLFSNWGSCNANYTGVITLKEGESYDFELTHVEQTGDAGVQVLAGLGDHTETFDATAFFPLTTSTDTIFLPGNKGLAFVAEGEGRLGDYNNNGQLDAGDLDLQAEQIVADPGDPAFDLNGDDVVDFKDRQVWINDLAVTWMGDANLNCVFDSSDQVQKFVQGKYEQDVVAGWADGDSNGDMRFNSSDMVADFVAGGYELAAKPGCVVEPPVNAAVAAVPEPSSMVLVLLGLAGLVGWTRRR